MRRQTPRFLFSAAPALFLVLVGCGATEQLESTPDVPDGDDWGQVEGSDPADQPVIALPERELQPVPGRPGNAAPAPTQPPTNPTTPTTPNAAIPECTKPILASFTKAEMQHPAAGSNGYVVPGAGRLTAIDSSITSLLQGDAAAALTYAASAEYTLCRGTGAEADLVMWRPAPGEGQAWFAFRTGPARPAIFEAPHPMFDSGTLEQSVYLFDRLKARALIASGTHRCANSQKAGCSGSTAVCGSSEPYRISDMAHTEQSVFQVAHVAFSEHFANDWVLSMHGMGASGASISNGTTFDTTPQAPSAQVALAYAKRISGTTTCNTFDGVPTRRHLCATTTPQGRHINGSPNACTTSPKSATGRFIHVEQNKSVRTNLQATGDALDEAIPKL